VCAEHGVICGCRLPWIITVSDGNEKIDDISRACPSHRAVKIVLKRFLSILVFVTAASGCSVTADGIGPAHRVPDASQREQAKEQLQENAAAAPQGDPGSDEPNGVQRQPGILVIGTTGPFRAIEPKDRDKYYGSYLKAAEQWHPGEPASMDGATFRDRLAGWASVQISGIPGIVYTRVRLLVPTDVAHEAQFASSAGSFLIGTTGDLVVGKGDRDGLVWLERVLCRDDGTYRTCAKDFQAGIFDENTGQELGKDLKPKENGRQVDVASYRKVARP
jgi:hypothetical protein